MVPPIRPSILCWGSGLPGWCRRPWVLSPECHHSQEGFGESWGLGKVINGASIVTSCNEPVATSPLTLNSLQQVAGGCIMDFKVTTEGSGHSP